MSCKFPGANGAVGYWGRSPWTRIEAEEIPEKTRVLLQDKLFARGVPVYLYLPVAETDAGVTACTCSKDTTSTNDRPCNECYGVGFVPGFRRFLHETIHFGASENATFTLGSCSIDTRIKPNRILMDSGATTSTIETPDKTFTNPNDDDWEVNVDSFLRATGNTVTTEFSTDNGGTFFDISLINGVNKPTGASGDIRFRITLTRASASDRSPAFEIVRMRRPESENMNQGIVDFRGNVDVGQILILRPWVVEQAMLEQARGVNVDWVADRSWTAPLDFFDTSITADTAGAVIRDLLPGPHPFIVHAAGFKTGERVVWTNFKWNEEFGILTHQSFDERRAQPGEFYYLVF